ncbi:MAG: threonylcarbamoyl-AMP synthase [Odoribacteraceae bacterium]|jgi:tRNA threonylcarbamoyl adenosine modification protein (Sua5/YciO/YrdC/YwlC family)|nr:threonylcarbamoyl-AMP synthase [Odoribacteraceae bacterium]
MYTRLFEDNPNDREIRKIVDLLKRGGVIIYPTDTIYAIGCDIYNAKAVQRVSTLRGVKPEKAHFSMICKDLGEVATYARVTNEVFRAMKRCLPGPFTFVLPGTNKLPNLLMMKRKTIGIRVPDNFITRAITTALGSPLLTTSVKGAPGEEEEYITDPELIHEKYEHLVDLVISGGYGKNVPSTVVDCTGDEITVTRQGLGEF